MARDELIQLPISPTMVAVLVVVVVAIAWLVLGGPVYLVGPDEEAVIQTFGKYTDSAGPGLRFKIPWPVQTVHTVKVTKVRRVEVGFRTISQGPPARYRDASNSAEMLREAHMLTGDENILNCSLTVQYKVKSATDYLFNVREPEEALRDIIESVVRQVIGDRPIDEALTVGKLEIQVEITENVQSVVDKYGLGMRIVAVKLQEVQPPKEVAAAFKDVATAKEDKQQIINAARGYQNERIPRARGEAAKMEREAEGFKQSRIARAKGDVARFIAIAEEYKKAPEITEKRLYLETMKKVMPKVKKVIIDENAGVINLNDLTGTLRGVK